MTISELVKELNAQKKKIGDVEVYINAKAFTEACNEYAQENMIQLHAQKVQLLDDNNRLEHRKTQILSICPWE